MRQRYVTKCGNWNGWWDKLQLVEHVTVRSHREAVEYVSDRNGGHDLYYFIGGGVTEGFLDEALDDELIMVGAPSGENPSGGHPFDVPYAIIDWDLLIYWPPNGDPIRVDFTFDPEAPELERLDNFEVDQYGILRKRPVS